MSFSITKHISMFYSSPLYYIRFWWKYWTNKEYKNAVEEYWKFYDWLVTLKGWDKLEFKQTVETRIKRLEEHPEKDQYQGNELKAMRSLLGLIEIIESEKLENLEEWLYRFKNGHYDELDD